MPNVQEILSIKNLSCELWYFLLPVIILSVSSILILILGPSAKGHQRGLAGTIVALIAMEIAIIYHWIQGGGASLASTASAEGIICQDSLALFSQLMIGGGGLMTALILWKNDQRHQLLPEVYALLLFSMIGMVFLCSSTNLLMLFVALEVMSLAIYILVAMKRQSQAASEAGLKYFIMGGVASGFFLYGTALVYGHTGTLDLAQISTALNHHANGNSLLLVLGCLMILVALLFKVGAFPFHAWVPDVYQGAVTPITGFMASTVKFVGFIVMIRLFQALLFSPEFTNRDIIELVLTVSTVITMIWGNVLALQQKSLKRLLAYSSIAHTGYLFLGILAVRYSPLGYQSVLFYLTVYLFSTIGAFGVVAVLSHPAKSDLEWTDLRGLAQRHPFLAFSLAVFLLSFAGIPLTAGFIGKYFLFAAALTKIFTLILIFAVAASLISLAYYLRVVAAMYQREEVDTDALQAYPFCGSLAMIALAAVMTIVLGIFPAKLLALIQIIF
jgi:NADH-quinone oxidoreductase subunit N